MRQVVLSTLCEMLRRVLESTLCEMQRRVIIHMWEVGRTPKAWREPIRDRWCCRPCVRCTGVCCRDVCS